MNKNFTYGVIASVFGAVSAQAAPTVVDSGDVGSCGTGCSWVFYDDGRLEVTGTGDNAEISMTSDANSATQQPWGRYKDIVRDIEVQGISYIPAGAFRRMASVERINIDESTTSIGYSALSTYSPATIFIPDSVTTFSADIPGHADIFTNDAIKVYCSTNNKDLCRRYMYTGGSSNPVNIQEYTKNPDGSYELLENGRASEKYASLKDFQNGNVLEKYGYDENGRQYVLSADGRLSQKTESGAVAYYNAKGEMVGLGGKKIYTVEEAEAITANGDKFHVSLTYK